MEHRPAIGSCPRCGGALGLAAIRVDGIWFCSSSCADGRVDHARRPAVPETRLLGRPRRFFRARRPKELRAAGSED